MKTSRWTLGRLFSLIPVIWDNPLSIFGAGLTTTSAFVIITVIILEWTGLYSNPYTGIIVYLVMPGLFLASLALIPLGNLIWRRQRARYVTTGRSPLIIQMNLNDPRFQRRTLVVTGFSLLNILIITTVSYQAVTFMDSNEFCGKVCHTVMTPEYTSYQNSPHSRVVV